MIESLQNQEINKVREKVSEKTSEKNKKNDHSKKRCCRTFTAFLIALIIATGLVWIPYQKTRPIPCKKPTLRFGYSLTQGSLPVLLAQDLGFLNRVECAVELFPDNKLTGFGAEFAARQIDGVTATAGSALKLTTIVPELRIVYVKDQPQSTEKIIAIPSIKTIADLKKKQVGIALGDVSEIFLFSLLKEHKISENELTLVNITSENAVQKFNENELDAVFVRPPQDLNITKPFRVLATAKDAPGIFLNVIFFHQEFLKNQAKCVRQFLSAWSDAVDYWKKKPTETAEKLAKRLNMPPSQFSLHNLIIFNTKDNIRIMNCNSKNESLCHTLTKNAEGLVQIDALKLVPNVEKFVDASFLSEP